MSDPGTTFSGSRRKAGLGFTACAAVVAVGWLLTSSGGTLRHSAEYHETLGWVTMIVGGLFAVPWLVSFFTPHQLVIETDGFSCKRALSKRKRCCWDDIAEIWVFSRHGSGIVVWKNKRATGNITRAIFGCDGWLPGGWEVSSFELASELQSAKEAHDNKTQPA